MADLQGQAMVPPLQVRDLHQLHLAALFQCLDPGAQFKQAVISAAHLLGVCLDGCPVFRRGSVVGHSSSPLKIFLRPVIK